MANNWAIVIGINHYDHHPERRLKYAVPDAQLMYDFLCTHASFAPDHTLLCLGDEEHRNSATYPNYSTLLKILNRDLHPNKVGKIDRLWFFFGGHGISQNGRDYLLTADSLLEDVELKIALPIDEVIASLQKHQEAEIVLILDSCRQLTGSRKLVADIGEQTVELAQQRGITTIFSCDYGQYSYELEAIGHGAFTHALVEGLKQYTLPGELEQYLQQKVSQLNQHNGQTPRIRIEPASKVFYPLLPSAVTRADIKVLIRQAIEAELAENFELAEQLLWQIISVGSKDEIQKAQTSIKRIHGKMGRSNRQDNVRSTAAPLAQPQIIPGSPQVSVSRSPEITKTSVSTSQPTLSSISQRSIETRQRPQLTRQKFLKIAIPSGVCVVVAASVGQILGEQVKRSRYSTLESFLKAEQWREANEETTNLILKAANREGEGLLDIDSINDFPCEVLNQIDRLWIDNSARKFGFSVQKRIYVENCGGNPDGNDDIEAWRCFITQVGWSKNNQWINYSDVQFNTDAPIGHLPVFAGFENGFWGWVGRRMLRCKS